MDAERVHRIALHVLYTTRRSSLDFMLPDIFTGSVLTKVLQQKAVLDEAEFERFLDTYITQHAIRIPLEIYQKWTRRIGIERDYPTAYWRDRYRKEINARVHTLNEFSQRYVTFSHTKQLFLHCVRTRPSLTGPFGAFIHHPLFDPNVIDLILAFLQPIPVPVLTAQTHEALLNSLHKDPLYRSVERRHPTPEEYFALRDYLISLDQRLNPIQPYVVPWTTARSVTVMPTGISPELAQKALNPGNGVRQRTGVQKKRSRRSCRRRAKTAAICRKVRVLALDHEWVPPSQRWLYLWRGLMQKKNLSSV